jgi:hemerythrin
MKKLLAWKQEFEIGIPVLDEQHHKFIDMVSEVQNNILTASREQLVRFFSFIYDYMINHFKTEEMFMIECRYPDTDEHVEEHREFREKIDFFYENFKKNNTQFIVVNIIDFMKDWIIGHLLCSDKALGEWYKYNKPDSSSETSKPRVK